MKKLLLSAISVVLLNTASTADILGAEVGYASWNPSLTGTIQKDADIIDFEDDLGFGSNQANSFLWVYIDHPVPILPNLKIQKTNYSVSATSINSNISTNVPTFTTVALTGKVDTKFTLNQLDIIAYWRILDNWVNFDLGLNLKKIDGNIKMNSFAMHLANKPVNESFNVTVPMLYTKARFDLPFTGASVKADISYISFQGNKLSDMKFGVVYESDYGLGGTIGMRKENITIDDVDGINGDINIDGIYAGLFYHF